MTLVFGTNLRPDHQIFAEVAALLAKRWGESLRLVHVSEDPRAPIVLGTDEEHLLGPIRSKLDEEAQRLRTQTGATVQPHLAAGNVAEALVSVAGFELATVLAVGTRAQRSSHLFGETAERVARKSVVPVLTLREPERMIAWLQGQQPLRILIGSDLGHAATAARAFAGQLAKLGACSTEIIYVVSPADIHKRMGIQASPYDHHLTVEEESALLRELTRTAPPAEKEAKLRVIPARGSPDAYLVTLAEQENFDLVLVGQRQQSLLEQFWSGSVSRGVIRASPVSTLCVPAPPDSIAKPFQPYQQIIVATDFTSVSQQAFSHALGLVAQGGTIRLVHVLPIINPALDNKDALQMAWSTISKIRAPESSANACTLQRDVLEGDPAEQILALAVREGADLIILGMRSRTNVSRTLLGSVARGLTENSRVPVLLIPFGDP
jgi:nucleotide-binding universal stress UspA family protein